MYSAWVLGNCTTKDTFYNDYILYNSLLSKGVNVFSYDFNKIFLNEEGLFAYDFFNNEIITSQSPDFVIFSQPLTRPDVSSLQNNETSNINDELIFSNYNTIIDRLKTIPTIFYNSINSHILCNNNLSQYITLKKNNISIPKTLMLGKNDSDEDIINKVTEVGGFPVVVKEIISTAGKGVSLCYNIAQIRDTVAKQMFNINPLLIQKYIDMKGKMIDVRVIGDKIYPSLVLSDTENNFKSNLTDNKSYIACKLDSNLEELVVKSMAALNINIARFDIFITDEGYQICEVNSIGSILSGELTWRKNIGQEIVDYCLSDMRSR